MKRQDIDFTVIPDAPGVYYFLEAPLKLLELCPTQCPAPKGEEKYTQISVVPLPMREGLGVGVEPELKKENILYVGKATSLRNRVKSYFDKDLIDTRGLRLVNMLLAAQSIAYKVTDNAMEALLLENILIKKYQPYYNQKEKDNKSYTCVIITDEDYPRVLTMRVREYEKRINVDKSFIKAKVYGPFVSAKDIKETLKIIRKIFPYRDKCVVFNAPLEGAGQRRHDDGLRGLSGNLPVGVNPCFNFQLGLCPGVCVGNITKVDYAKNIRSIKYLFEGKSKSLIKELEKEMKSYAKEQKFELAAERRNAIYRLGHISDIAFIHNEELEEWKDGGLRIEAYDIAHISGSERVGVMTVVEGGVKKPAEYRKFKLEADINDDYGGIREIISRRMKHNEWKSPDLIVFDGGVGQKNAGDGTLIALGYTDIATVSVVKDDKHKAKGIIGNYIDNIGLNTKDKKEIEAAIYLANSEAHRYSLKWHRERRDRVIK